MLGEGWGEYMGRGVVERVGWQKNCVGSAKQRAVTYAKLSYAVSASGPRN